MSENIPFLQKLAGVRNLETGGWKPGGLLPKGRKQGENKQLISREKFDMITSLL